VENDVWDIKGRYQGGVSVTILLLILDECAANIAQTCYFFKPIRSKYVCLLFIVRVKVSTFLKHTSLKLYPDESKRSNACAWCNGHKASDQLIAPYLRRL
jgi:hypothetical protein